MPIRRIIACLITDRTVMPLCILLDRQTCVNMAQKLYSKLKWRIKRLREGCCECRGRIQNGGWCGASFLTILFIKIWLEFSSSTIFFREILLWSFSYNKILAIFWQIFELWTNGLGTDILWATFFSKVVFNRISIDTRAPTVFAYHMRWLVTS